MSKFSIPKDHPLAQEILEAASRLDEGDEQKLRLYDLLTRAGLPLDTFVEPQAGAVDPVGEVLFRTGDPAAPDTVVRYETNEHVMLLHEAFKLGPELIAAAEAVGFAAWEQGAQVAGDGKPYVSAGRTSRNMDIGGHHLLARFDEALTQAVHSAALFYSRWNPHCAWTRNEGWQLMRYEPGQKFDLHVDAIAGNPRWASRQLSVLVYLNDDYEGGETHFPLQATSLKPKAGTIALFPPFWTHPHEARPPVAGTKYAVVGWLH